MAVLSNFVNETRNWIVVKAPFFLAYAVWLIASAFLALPLLYGIPGVSGILEKLDATRWAISAVQRFGFVGIGLLWLIAVLLAEHLLRTSAGNGTLGKAIGRVAKFTGFVVIGTAIVFFLPSFM